MQIDASKNQSFSMDYTTKSGKHLALSMYDNQSVSYTNNEEGKLLILSVSMALALLLKALSSRKMILMRLKML